MDYRSLSIEQIIARINATYCEKERQKYAFNYVANILNKNELERITKDGEFDAMNYLAEYFSKGEWKEWLIQTFIED